MSEYELFFDAVTTAAAGTPIAFPNVAYAGEEPYYRVFIMPSEKRGLGVAFISSDRQRGFCQVSCYVRDGAGEIQAVTLADKIKDAFPKGTKLTDTITVQIDDPAYSSPGLATDGWYMIPVTIPYYIIS